MEHNRSTKYSRHKMWRTLKKYLKTELSNATRYMKECQTTIFDWEGKPKRTCETCRAEMRERILSEIFWEMCDIDMSGMTENRKRRTAEGEICEE